MAYEVVILYYLHMPSFFLGTFTEYPSLSSVLSRIVLKNTHIHLGVLRYKWSYV